MQPKKTFWNKIKSETFSVYFASYGYNLRTNTCKYKTLSLYDLMWCEILNSILCAIMWKTAEAVAFTLVLSTYCNIRFSPFDLTTFKLRQHMESY